MFTWISVTYLIFKNLCILCIIDSLTRSSRTLPLWKCQSWCDKKCENNSKFHFVFGFNYFKKKKFRGYFTRNFDSALTDNIDAFGVFIYSRDVFLVTALNLLRLVEAMKMSILLIWTKFTKSSSTRLRAKSSHVKKWRWSHWSIDRDY